ncbi:hypothetical protein LUD75_13185 [Epilithonimonas sp. JDS]|uniref:hypothetical protein n=1 Tax=Epilithonimonas sp. JDS TaxID=2902797 RepID=UPI001E32256D|nr:hypothetical protein [Epilithonimonas sp. JDS]MCD9855670.1 hypothetical protein [Epilithonimonas sp. JDS]
MKNTFLILSAALMMLCSCEKNIEKQINVENRKPDTLAVSEDPNQISEKENVDYCYMNVVGKDSMFLSYKIMNGNVSGKLKYKNFEKDSNFGDIIGKVAGDTLRVNYKFTSEGSVSEREIYFLQDSGVLLEGIGDYADPSASKLVYSSPKAINYSKGQRLTPADCKMISGKLK